MRLMLRASLLIAALGLASCGYTFGRDLRPISVAPIKEPGIDVDAAPLLTAAIRHAVARGPGTRLAGEESGAALLQVELLSSTSGLTSFADPAVRAAQYRAVVNVRATLVGANGKTLWQSSVITGEAPYLSTPGAIEKLEGARRRALERAAEDAAERLVASLRWRD